MYNTPRINIGYWFFFICIQCSYGLDDNESWTSIGFERNLPYSLELEFEQELRLNNQLSTFKQTFSEVSISYEVFDGLKIQIPYRYAVFENKIKQRLSFGGSYKYSFKPVSLKYRTKFQRTNEDGELPEELIRNKFTIEYKLGKRLNPIFLGNCFIFIIQIIISLMGLEFHLVLPLIFHERTQLRFSTFIKKRTSSSQARMKLMCLV